MARIVFEFGGQWIYLRRETTVEIYRAKLPGLYFVNLHHNDGSHYNFEQTLQVHDDFGTLVATDIAMYGHPTYQN